MTKIAILGANGFIGSFLKNYLIREGREIISVTRSDLDLADFEQVYRWLLKEKPNIIVNCAASILPAGFIYGTDHVDVSIERNNLSIFLNFFNTSYLFDKFINIGSGAEFDKSKNIIEADEDEIFFERPKDSYGYSKNVISRLCSENDKFYTLRIFSIYHHTEPSYKLFKNLVNCDKKKEPFTVMNRSQDFITMTDFAKIVNYYIDNVCYMHDINCVYNDKVTIGNLVGMFCDIAGISQDRIIYKQDDINYTGNGDKLNSLKIDFSGHEYEMREYINHVYA